MSGPGSKPRAFTLTRLALCMSTLLQRSRRRWSRQTKRGRVLLLRRGRARHHARALLLSRRGPLQLAQPVCHQPRRLLPLLLTKRPRHSRRAQYHGQRLPRLRYQHLPRLLRLRHRERTLLPRLSRLALLLNPRLPPLRRERWPQPPRFCESQSERGGGTCPPRQVDQHRPTQSVRTRTPLCSRRLLQGNRRLPLRVRPRHSRWSDLRHLAQRLQQHLDRRTRPRKPPRRMKPR